MEIQLYNFMVDKPLMWFLTRKLKKDRAREIADMVRTLITKEITA